jgi:hypothetical protein
MKEVLLSQLKTAFPGSARRSSPVPQGNPGPRRPNPKVFWAATATGYLMLDTSGSGRVEGGFECEVPALVFPGVALSLRVGMLGVCRGCFANCP